MTFFHLASNKSILHISAITKIDLRNVHHFYRTKLCISRSLLSTGVRLSVRHVGCIVLKRLNLPSNVFFIAW